MIALYAKDATPILDKIETMMASGDQVWLPIVFESVWTSLYEAQQTRAVARVMKYSFLDAVHQGDNGRAIRILKMSKRLFGRNHHPTFLVEELIQIACYSQMLEVTRDSIAANVWSDTELEEIESVVEPAIDWDDQWKQTIESEMLSILPDLIRDDGSLVGSASPGVRLQLAPSTRRLMVDRQHEVSMIRGVGTSRHLEEVTRVANDWRAGDQVVEIDRWLQIPTLATDWIEGLVMPAYGSVASAFRRVVNEERFTQAIFSLRKYRSQTGEWPDDLSQLSKLGLVPSSIEAFDGGPFHYEIDDGRAVIYDQSHHRIQYDDVGREALRMVMVGD